MLPGMNGIEVCQQIRRSSNVPIIMLTAKSDTEDVVKGLEAGADDYIAKPFKHAELLARIRTRLRPRESRQLVVSIGDIVMDMDGRTVKYHDTEVPMTPLEFDLLAALVRHPGQALSRQELLDMVWGYTDVSDSLVNVHVQRLRAKFDELGADRFIQTVRGVGYKIPTELRVPEPLGRGRIASRAETFRSGCAGSGVNPFSSVHWQPPACSCS